MTFLDYLIVYLLALAVFSIVDAVWLGSIAKDLYKHHLKKKLALPPNWPAAITFYLLFIAGLVYFAIIPGLDSNNAAAAAVDGALYGFFTYVTYQFTNLATLKNWPTNLVAIDVAWGSVVSFTTATLVYVIYNGLT